MECKRVGAFKSSWVIHLKCLQWTANEFVEQNALYWVLELSFWLFCIKINLSTTTYDVFYYKDSLLLSSTFPHLSDKKRIPLRKNYSSLEVIHEFLGIFGHLRNCGSAIQTYRGPFIKTSGSQMEQRLENTVGGVTLSIRVFPNIFCNVRPSIVVLGNQLIVYFSKLRSFLF